MLADDGQSSHRVHMWRVEGSQYLEIVREGHAADVVVSCPVVEHFIS